MLFKKTKRTIEVKKGYAERVGDIIAEHLSWRICSYEYGYSEEQYCRLSFEATDFEYKKVLKDLDIIRKMDASIVKIA